MTDDFRLAAKACILCDDRLLAVRRAAEDVQKPGIWELPGGRLQPGEEPRNGLAREVREETGLAVTVEEPLTVRHFQRDDGQTITMICFRATPDSSEVSLSGEHTAYDWVPLKSAKERLDSFFKREIDACRD
ncbi:MAG: NUDIX domain-containing protein [Candidatus Nanohaloarchaea archaeon]|nr:NUDIX domain-containing protein [Candidatus Nanohaloarchaea archaeon]